MNQTKSVFYFMVFVSFQYVSGELKLLETPYSSTLASMIDLHLHHQHSIPVFLSSITLDLFSRQTMTMMEPITIDWRWEGAWSGFVFLSLIFVNLISSVKKVCWGDIYYGMCVCACAVLFCHVMIFLSEKLWSYACIFLIIQINNKHSKFVFYLLILVWSRRS